MIFQNEKQILKIIKYSPSIFIIMISFIILSIQFVENNSTFEKEKNKIKTEYINSNKEYIKKRVYEVYNYIRREQVSTENELKESLKVAINNANAIANGIYINNKDKDEKFIKKLIIDALRDIRFNDGRGYFFIYENSGKNLLLPHNPELEGNSFWNHKDSKGSYIIQDMTKLLKQDNQAFYEWYWYNPKKPDIQRKKIGLVKNFLPFNWFIGTGEYLEDYEEKIQEKILSDIKEIRFKNNGYIFIISYDSIYLTHIKDEFIGKNAITNNDTVNIKTVMKDLIDISIIGEGFYTYTQNKKPTTNMPVEKTSFVKGLDKWSWMIGSGFYKDDMQKAISKRKKELDDKFKEYVIKTIKISFFLTIFLLFCSIYFSRILQRKFKKYKKEIRQHLVNNTRQQNIMAQQSKMAAMGEMIGNIAHQWRQPLSAITTTATGIRLHKDMNILEDKLLEEGLDNINDSAQFLSKTIDDFRNFFKINKETTYFSIQKTLDKSISLVNVQFHNMDIEIIKNHDDVEINNYENEFIQVIINLLNNARDELIKKDSKFRKMIFIDIKKENKKIKILFKDNAGGIKKDIIERIFEPYFTTKHRSQGTGIGLYMSREIIIKNMKGTILVKNSSFSYDNINYSGAVFEITLPIDK